MAEFPTLSKELDEDSSASLFLKLSFGNKFLLFIYQKGIFYFKL